MPGQGPGFRRVPGGTDPGRKLGKGDLPQGVPSRGPFGGRERGNTNPHRGPPSGMDAAAVVGGDGWHPLNVQRSPVPPEAVAEIQVDGIRLLRAEDGADVRWSERPRQIARQTAVTGWHAPEDGRCHGGSACTFRPGGDHAGRADRRPGRRREGGRAGHRVRHLREPGAHRPGVLPARPGGSWWSRWCPLRTIRGGRSGCSMRSSTRRRTGRRDLLVGGGIQGAWSAVPGPVGGGAGQARPGVVVAAAGRAVLEVVPGAAVGAEAVAVRGVGQADAVGGSGGRGSALLPVADGELGDGPEYLGVVHVEQRGADGRRVARGIAVLVQGRDRDD